MKLIRILIQDCLIGSILGELENEMAIHSSTIAAEYKLTLGFPGGSEDKESACNAGNLSSIPELGRCPGGGHGNPFQYSCLENPHGQRSLMGYIP